MGAPAVPEVPTRWLLHQQLLFAASLHGVGGNATAAEQDNLFSLLWPDSLAPTGADLSRYEKELQTLPPSLLELLCELTDNQIDCWEDHQKIWQDVLTGLRWNSDRRRSRLAGAKLIVERLRSGFFQPPQIRRLARTELTFGGADWDDVADIDERLSQLSHSLQHDELVYDQLAALAAFNKGRKPARWEMVENALLQQFFSWPLLVTPGGTSCALPVLVNLHLRDSAPDGPTEFVIDGPCTNGSDWAESLAKARHAAVDLWLSKHSSADLAFQVAVANAEISLDLRVASAVVARSLGGEKLRLEGGSLETYVALEILSLILEGRGTKDLCATGELGAWHGNGAGRHKERKGGFYDVKAIVRKDSTTDWIEEKVDCARRSFFFDRILLPEFAVEAGRRDHLRVVGVPVSYIEARRMGLAGGLAGFANEAFGQVWRRHRYVRCPDVALRFKEERYTGFSWKSDRLLSVFRATASAVVRPSEYSASDVAHALYWVNQHAEKDYRVSRDELGGNERLGRFAFLRATQDELNERFWASVWDVCGGSPTTYRRFVLAPNAASAAAELAALLNATKPTREKRTAAPDVLVVIGASHLRPRRGQRALRSDPFQKFRLDVLAKLMIRENLLETCPNRLLREHLGKTRLIILQDDYEDWQLLHGYPDPKLASAIQRLSVFRFGFTQPMARNVLSVNDAECDRILEALSRRDSDMEPVLTFAENAQEWFLHGRAPPLPEDAARAALHFKAANSIIGLLDRTQRPSHHDFDTALRPDYLHEAQWQIQRSRECSAAAARLRKPSPLLSKAVDARERLSRIGEPFTWSQLRWATVHSSQAHEEMWLGLLSAIDAMGEDAVHPLQWLWAARFAYKMEAAGGDGAVQYGAARLQMLERAEAASGRLPLEESDASLFMTLTTRSWMEMKNRPDRVGHKVARADIDRSWELYPNAIEILSAEWFEQCGDGVEDPEVALSLYGRGFLSRQVSGAESLRASALVKWLGCLCLLDSTPSREQWEEILHNVSPDTRWDIEGDLGLRTGLHHITDAKRRWLAGRRLLDMEGLIDADRRHRSWKSSDSALGRRFERERSPDRRPPGRRSRPDARPA